MPTGFSQGVIAAVLVVLVLARAARRQPDSVWRLVLAAFLLRFTVGFIGEFYQVFPDYYYYDAVTYEEYAWRFVGSIQADQPVPKMQSLSHQSYGVFLGVIYLLFGRAPLLLKVINSLAGSLTVLVVYRTALLVGTSPETKRRTAFWAAALAAVWPSSLFWSGNIFRDPLIGLFTTASVWLMAEWLASMNVRLLMGSAALAFVAVLLRTQQAAFWLLTLIGSLPGIILAVRTQGQMNQWGRSTGDKRRLIIGLLLAVTVLLIIFYGAVLTIPETARNALITPEKLTQIHQHLTSDPAGSHGGTTLFPDLAFDDWVDVFYFLPKGLLYVLFMPFPFLYPMEGNPGRWLSGAENLVLFGFAALALGYLWKFRRGRPAAAWPVIVFLALMSSAQALTEPDLGSAMRHKSYYIPYLVIMGLDRLFSRTRS